MTSHHPEIMIATHAIIAFAIIVVNALIAMKMLPEILALVGY